MPTEPITVYNLGELGVNLVKSPIHLEDGELVQAQNAEFYREQGRGAIRKRPALQSHNDDVLSGTIGGAIGVPLPGPDRRAVYVQSLSSPFFRKTEDGTTWDYDDNFRAPCQSDGTLYNLYPMFRAAICGRQFFYPLSGAVSYNYGAINGYDGLTQYEVVRFGYNVPNLRTLCQHNDQIVFAGDFTEGVRVYLCSPVTGDLTQVGGSLTSPEEIMCGISYQGRIWIGTGTNVTGKIYSAAPNETAWTTERTAGANQKMYTSLAVRSGELFAGTYVQTAGTAALVEKRTSAGVWSTSTTTAVTTSRNNFDGLIRFGGDLYAVLQSPDESPNPICQVMKYNGSAWSLDKDLGAAGDSQVGGVVAVGRSLYYNANTGGSSSVWRKLNTTWTRVDQDLTSGPGPGLMGVI